MCSVAKRRNIQIKIFPKMDCKTRNELIAKTALELIQNVLPTNIMSNLDLLDGQYIDSDSFSDDFDETKFIQCHLMNKTPIANSLMEASGSKEDNSSRSLDNSESLTYFEIVEQEMMSDLCVTADNIKVKATFDYDSIEFYNIQTFTFLSVPSAIAEHI